MTEPGEPSVSLRCARLSRVIRWDHFRLHGTEVDQIRELMCVADGTPRDWTIEVQASAAEARRWRRTTAELVAATNRAWTDQSRAESRRVPPSAAVKWLAWRLRGGRTDRVLEEVRAELERIQTEVRAAYRDFRDQAADLTVRIEAHQRRRREESAREYRDQKAARERAIAEVSEAPVWSYQVGPRHAPTEPRNHRLVIALQTLERPPDPSLGDPVTDLNPAQVNESIDRLRADDPYLVVEVASTTRDSLAEWTEEKLLSDQWQRVSGTRIDPYPFTPEELDEIRKRVEQTTYHGPLSTYFSPPSF